VPDRASGPTPHLTDFRALYSKLEDALAEIQRTDNVAETLERILERLIDRFQDELGIRGGRIYRRDEDQYFLCCGFGSSRSSRIGLRVPEHYPPHLRTLAEGLVIMRKGDRGFDEEFERSIGVEERFAAIAVGKENRFVIAFSIDGEASEERLLYSLSAVRHVIHMKLDQEAFTGMLAEARAIQEGLLPAAPPDLPGYDIAGRSLPAESVGGDVFDYLPISDERMGIAIADASGHGLPAALMARDVVTALRTVVDDEIEVDRAVERVNRVVHRAALARKFISLVYGELNRDGTLVYCNAGHSPPLLRTRDGVLGLNPGGPVLGPIAGARYRSERVRLAPGDTLVLFTDGVVERENRGGDFFGVDRLRGLIDELGRRSAASILEAIFAALDAHGEQTTQRDDMTAVVVRRL